MINDYKTISLTNHIVNVYDGLLTGYIYIYIHLIPKCNSKNLHFKAISLVRLHTFLKVIIIHLSLQQ